MENLENRGQEYTMEQGVLRCVVPDPAIYYREVPARVLALFVAAAAKDCAIEADTYIAAMGAVDGISRLPAAVVRSALQNILLSPRPEAIAPLLARGVLTPFGLRMGEVCLHELAKVPCAMEVRWWRFLRLVGADYRTVCDRLGFAPAFAAALAGLDKLSGVQVLPETVLELKLLLSALPELDYEAAVKTLALEDARWESQLVLYDRLYRSGEPYRMRELAITVGQLAVLGIRDKRAAWVQRQLLEAVIKSPEINQYPALEMLARTLNQQYQGT